MTAAATSHIWDLIRDVPTAERIASAAHVTTKRGSPATAFVIAGEKAVDELLTSFEQFSDERWEWQKWFHHAFTSGAPVIGLRDLESGTLAGFASLDRQAFVTSSPFSGMIDLELEITSVYVRPDFRGKGYGAALREASAAYLKSVIDGIAGISDEAVADFGLSGLSVTVSSYPESHEGHVFATRLYTEVSEHLASLSETAWFGQAALIDQTDPEEELSLT
jgi:GNAT superfamily N-acetyltransferase